MKKFLSYILILFIILTGTLFPRGVHAQYTDYQDCLNKNQSTGNASTICDSVFSGGNDLGIKETESANSSSSCSGILGWAFCFTTATAGKIIAPIISGLAWLIMKILSLFLMIAGLLLNFTLDVTVLQMADRIKGMTGINIAWKVLRDLMNIGFIFMLLYQGIRLIISQDSIDSIRKFIIGIVLASLLINFSLFFTKVIIDASNIATIGIYNTIIGDTDSKSTGADRGLSNAFMNALGVQQFFSWDATNPIGNVEDDYSHMTSNIMACILIIITTVVFLAISIMFIVRYVVLIFLLALSPVAYMGMAFKGLEKMSSKWWATLWGQVIFAPLYMLMTWVTLTLIAGNFTTSSATIELGSTTVAASANIFFNFAIIIGLTIASLFIAKDYSTQGAGEVKKFSEGMMSFAGGAVFGGAGAGLRNTVGRLGLRGTNVEELEARVAKGGVDGQRAQARLALATGSFDARKSKVVESTTSAAGINFGKGLPFNPKAGEGGRAAVLSGNKKDREEDMDAVMKDYVNKRNWAGLAKYVKDGKPAIMSSEEWEKRQQYIYKKLSARDRVSLEERLTSDFGPAIADPLIGKMRGKLPLDEQIKVYTDRKDWIKTADFIRTTVKDGVTKPRDPQEQEYIYEKMTPRDRVELDKVLTPTEIATLRAGLSTEDLEKTKESERKVKAADTQDKILENVENMVAGRPVVTPAGGTAPTYDTEMVRLSPKEARNLSNDALKHLEVIKKLTPLQLADIIANKDDLTPDAKDEIRDQILTAPTGSWALLAAQTKYLRSTELIKANWGVI